MSMLVVSFSTDQHEVVIGLMSVFPFDGFQEFDDRVEAYIAQEDWENSKADVLKLLGDLAEMSSVTALPEVNWNAMWESSFHPVIIDEYCAIRASFHDPIETCRYEIVIDPKMAFGTGHHETTELMIRLLEFIDLSGKRVLDMGTGTGILGILAVMQGAAEVIAVDNDPEAVSNATENALINDVHMHVVQGHTPDFVQEEFDVILANINRNTLLEILPDLASMVRPDGSMLLSGYLDTDREAIHNSAEKHALQIIREENIGDWCALQLAQA